MDADGAQPASGAAVKAASSGGPAMMTIIPKALLAGFLLSSPSAGSFSPLVAPPVGPLAPSKTATTSVTMDLSRSMLGRRVLQDASVCADLSTDGAVDVTDLLIMLGAFGSSTLGDIDGDGLSDVTDLLVLLGQFGSLCSSSPRVCAPVWSGADHACRGDHSYVGAHFDGTVNNVAECQALCQADAACTGGSYFAGDSGTVQWNGELQVAFNDGCHLFGAAGSWPSFDVCPEHWSIYTNPAVQSFECSRTPHASVVYPYMENPPQTPSCGEGFYVNAEWARNPPDWFHRSIVSGIIHRDFGSTIIEYPVPFAWPCWLCQPGSFPGTGCASAAWYHGDLNFNAGWGRPTPTTQEPCCVKCALNTYDDDLDSTTPCVACPAGKHTKAIGSAQCAMDACPAGQCGVAPLYTATPNSGVQCAASTAANCWLESWNSATDMSTGAPLTNADGDTFTIYKLPPQPASTFYGPTPSSASQWDGEYVGGINYCTFVDPAHESCDPNGESTAAAQRYADLCFAAGLRPLTVGEFRYYPSGEWGYTTW